MKTIYSENPQPASNFTALGIVESLTSNELPTLQVLRYLPRNFNRKLAPILFIHGYNRQLASHFAKLKALSDATGRAILAPLFDRHTHPNYQRLARGRDGLHADRLLQHCREKHLDPLLEYTGGAILVGFSAGAQFAHRFTLAHPAQVEQLIAVAAGWYTLPNEQQQFPTGIRHRRHRFHPEQFLRVPITVVVGSDDTGSINFRRNENLDRQQGVTRVERARNWVISMRSAARRYGVEASIEYLEVPGIGHDFDEFAQSGSLVPLLTTIISEHSNATEVIRVVA